MSTTHAAIIRTTVNTANDAAAKAEAEAIKNEISVVVGAVGFTMKAYEEYPKVKLFVNTCIELRKAGDYRALAQHIGKNGAQAGVKLLPKTVQNAVKLFQLVSEHGPKFLAVLRTAAAAGETTALLGSDAAAMTYTTRSIRIGATLGRMALAAGKTVGQILLTLGRSALSGPMILFTLGIEAVGFAIPAIMDWYANLDTDEKIGVDYRWAHPFTPLTPEQINEVIETKSRLGQMQFLEDALGAMQSSQGRALSKDAFDWVQTLMSSVGDADKIDLYWPESNVNNRLLSARSVETNLKRLYEEYRREQPDLFDRNGNFVNFDSEGYALPATHVEMLERNMTLLELQFTSNSTTEEDVLRSEFARLAMELYMLKTGTDADSIETRNGLFDKIATACLNMTPEGYQFSPLTLASTQLENFWKSYNANYTMDHQPPPPPPAETKAPTGHTWSAKEHEDYQAKLAAGAWHTWSAGVSTGEDTKDYDADAKEYEDYQAKLAADAKAAKAAKAAAKPTVDQGPGPNVGPKRPLDTKGPETAPKNPKYTPTDEAFDIDGGDPFDTKKIENTANTDNIDLEGIFRNLDYNISFDIPANSKTIFRNRF